ncbi:MAG: glycosyltransferase family 39 protein [Candidatus Poribacteria bacterium]
MRKADPYIIILLALGVVVFLTKCLIAYPIQYVGHADASGYAEMADSLVHGRGFEVDYISFYFIKYPHIYRPEDHWPPLYSIFIAPFYIIFGKSAFSAKLPSIIISCFFLPLVIYYLTKELSKSRITSLSAGVTVLLSPSFYEWSLHCLSDVIFAFVVCAFVLFAVKSLDKKQYFYLAGFFMGLSYYAKGSAIVLIPCYIFFYILCNLKFHRWKLQIKPIWDALKNKAFLIGLLIAFLVLLPWFVRNFIHFHDPLFSTQRFAAGYGGYVDWEIGTYDLYWGEKPPPTYHDKFKDGIGYVADMTWKYFKTNVWWTFMDIYSQWGKFSKRAFLTYFVCLPAIPGIFLLWGNKKRHIIWMVALALLIFLSLGWFPIDRMVLPIIPLMMALGWSAYYIILKTIFKYLDRGFAFIFDLFSGFFLGKIDKLKRSFSHKDIDSCKGIVKDSVFKSPLPPFFKGGIFRFPFFKGGVSFPPLPKGDQGGFKDLYLIYHSFFSRKIAISQDMIKNNLLVAKKILFNPRISTGFAILCFLAPFIILSSESINSDKKSRGYPFREADEAWMDMGIWLKNNAPYDSVTMTRNPWELHFYSDQPAVQIPRTNLDKTMEVMRFYNVNYIIPQLNIRPSLEPLVTGKILGLQLVYDNKTLQLYKIRYDLLGKQNTKTTPNKGK